MIEFPAKIAGVIQRGDQLLYLLAQPSNGTLRVTDFGSINRGNLASESEPLRGSKIICGINHRQFSSKIVKTISGAITEDPDCLLWELSRSYTESIDNYYFTFLNLLSNDNSLDRTAVFAAKRRTFARLGQLFEEAGLVLHQLVFEPEALRQMTRRIGAATRTAVLLIEQDHAYFQLHARGRLLTVRSLWPVDTCSQAGRRKLAEEIGTLLLSAPAAYSIDRRLVLLLIGAAIEPQLAASLSESLPYETEAQRITPSEHEFKSADSFRQQFDRYYLPFSLAYLYNKGLQCESSPAKSEVWS